VDEQGNPIEAEDEEESDDDEDDYDSTYDSDSTANFSDDERNKGCPADLDPEVYNKVCELRERRMDQEDIIAEIQKAIEVLSCSCEADT
jgi:hypothetical protein